MLVVLSFNFVAHKLLTFGDRSLQSLAQIWGWRSFRLAIGFDGLFEMGVATAICAADWRRQGSGMLGSARRCSRQLRAGSPQCVEAR